MNILNSDGDARTLRGFNCGARTGVGRTRHNFIAAVPRDQGKKIAEEGASFVRGLVHFPVGGEQLLSRHKLRWRPRMVERTQAYAGRQRCSRTRLTLACR